MTTNDTTSDRRVVVTGLGAVSPLGLDAESTWAEIIAGRSGVGPVTSFDASDLATRIAASVKDFDAGRYMDLKEARRLSLFIQYAIAAAQQALDQAGLAISEEERFTTGVEIGSALGGSRLLEEQRIVLEQRGPRAVNPTFLPAILINSAACAVAIRHGIHGPVNAPVAACATGALAIGEAARRLRSGEADVMLAGGSDSATTRLGIVGFGRLGALSTKNDTPERACAPFSADRDGTVVGEGAAILVLETLAHARRRGATILAELAGWGLTCDALHLVMPDPDGTSAARAMTAALQQAGLREGELSWVCAHGTGTQLNDASETKAIKAALGAAAYTTPVSSIKGALGHMLGAAGAIAAVTAVQAIAAGVIPPTINYAAADPDCDLDYVPNAPRRADVRAALVNAFGFGGQNATLLFRRWG
ncbi:MAG: 3-oxoacyl-(acyl-carrier-protein) synthase 2 [Chloroflexi bacterium ADurb.Bin325]|nr:MAG: 3-oxoacyl-(acyl-carrier-protein) synthase 2 [Chloroflexi bacterium ADurb.Bin325]